MSDSESHRFADPVMWLLLFVFGVLLYLFAYPLLLGLAYTVFKVQEVEFLNKILTASAVPLKWLYEHVPAYELYIEIIEGLMMDWAR